MDRMITSAHNENIRLAKSLISSRKARKKNNLIILEGVRLVEEAISAGLRPEKILFSNKLNQRGKSIIQHLPMLTDCIVKVDSDILSSISDTETSQGILMIASEPTPVLSKALDFILILDEVRDPGNLGTLLRTADAACVQAVIITPGTTDPYAPKVLRAGMGAHFHIPIIFMDWEKIKYISENNLPGPINLVLADIKPGAISLWEHDFCKPTAVIVSSEAFGSSKAAVQHATERCTIPMPGNIESLNAAVAGGILLFEVIRQRTMSGW